MTNKQKVQAERARRAAKLQKQAEYLRENRAWNWVWPGDGVSGRRNCWFTGLKPRNPNSTHDGIELLGTHPYFGPSKGTLKKRQARRGLRVAETSQMAQLKVGVGV